MQIFHFLLDLNQNNDLSSEYVNGPLGFKILRISILLGLTMTEDHSNALM